MAIKLADTLAPMADFPAVEAKDVAFNDNKSLQEKYDNGELGGGGTSITVDTAMSSTSTNPVQNKVIKAYVDSKSVDISADLDNAIQNKTDGIYVEKTKISTDDGNALSEKSNGLFVEDLSNKVNALNIAQKTVNSELEYYYATKTTSISGVSIKDSNLINYLSYLTNITSNLEPSRYSTKGVTLKKSKTYRITFGLARATTSGNGTSAYVMDSDGNKLGNRGYFGSNSYSDNIIDVIYTPTKDISVYPALVNLNTNLGSTYYPDCSFFQITEVGREVTIDPVEYVDSTKGIEDTPVGEIITTLGDETPKHYLACDGSTHNIADYPHLAQYFKDTFGTINYFGGDGITTFAVPKLSEPKLTKISPIMTSDTTPSPYVVTRSSVWSVPADHAWRIFDGIKTDNEDYTWISAANELNPWICVDLGTKTKMTSFKLWLDTGKNKFPEDFTLQGSNDGTNFTNIKSFTNVSSMAQSSEGEIEFNLDRIAEYRYYKIYVDTLQITGGATYVRIYEWEMFYQDPLYKNCIKYEPTYFMNLEGVEVTEDLLTDKLFDITTNGVTTIDKSFTLPTPITDFDEIETVYSYEKAKVVVKDSVSGTVATATKLTPTSDYKGVNFPGTSTSGITYQTIPGLTYPLTVEIAFSTTSNASQIVFVHDVGLNLIIGITGKHIQLAADTYASKTNMAYNISSWNLNDGNFHTITVTYNSTNLASLYFDGVLKPSITYSSAWTMTNISSIGNRFNSAYDGAFKGTLYAVRFYNNILSQSDIVASYNSDKNYVLNNTAQITRNNLACEYKLYDSVEIIHPYITSSRLSVRDIEYNSVLSVDKSVQNVTNNKAASTELQYTFIDKNNVKFLNVSNHYNSYLPGSKFGIRRLTGIRKISK